MLHLSGSALIQSDAKLTSVIARRNLKTANQMDHDVHRRSNDFNKPSSRKSTSPSPVPTRPLPAVPCKSLAHVIDRKAYLQTVEHMPYELIMGTPVANSPAPTNQEESASLRSASGRSRRRPSLNSDIRLSRHTLLERISEESLTSEAQDLADIYDCYNELLGPLVCQAPENSGGEHMLPVDVYNSKRHCRLPENVLSEVMASLPFDDLWKSCRSVSRQWKRLSEEIAMTLAYADQFFLSHLKMVQIKNNVVLPAYLSTSSAPYKLKSSYCAVRCQSIEGSRVTFQVIKSDYVKPTVTPTVLVCHGERDNQLWFRNGRRGASCSNNEMDTAQSTITMDLRKIYNLL